MKPGLFSNVTARLASFFGGGSVNYDSARWSPARVQIQHTAPSDLKQEQTSADQREILRMMRSLDKNSTFVAAFVNAHITYGVGDGYRYQPLTKNPEWNTEAKAQVELFHARPEITTRFSWLQVLKLACRALKIDGEQFYVKTRHRDGMPCLQIIEAHRVVQPDIENTRGWVNGIKYDKQGRPTTYAVRQDDGSFVYYGAAQVIHLYDPERATGTRGISPIQVATMALRDRAEIIAAEKQAVKEFSRRTFVLKSGTGEFDQADANFFGSNGKANKARTTNPEDIDKKFGGLSMAIGTNESLEAFETSRPNLNVLAMAEALDREVSNALGISSDFLLNPTKIGGPVVRMELAKAEREFSKTGRILIDGLVRPATQYFLADRIAGNDQLPASLAAQDGWQKMAFSQPRRLSIDVGRDTNAMIRELEAGTRNLQDVIEEGGDDAEVQVAARLDFKAWCKREAEARGLSYEDVSMASTASQPLAPSATAPAPLPDLPPFAGEEADPEQT